MRSEEFTCPICGEGMVERQGPKIKFLGCSMFPRCKGKRTLEGTVFGVDDEPPLGLSDEAESWFYTGIQEGMDYDEAREMALDWQRHEND